MKILKFKFLVVLIAFVALGAACSDDSEEEVSPFVGNFVISQAKVATTFSLSTKVGAQIPVAAGTDITQSIQAALLSSVNCSSASKSWIELRKDKSMYMSCEGQNAVNAGTWEEKDAATLQLNMNSTAVKPNGFLLSVTDIVKNSAGLSGKTSVPMPKEMFAPMLTPFGMTIADVPAIYMVTFTLDFVKK